MKYKKNRFIIFYVFNIILLFVVLFLAVPASNLLKKINLDDNEFVTGQQIINPKKGVPDGVEKFKSKVGKDSEFTFTIPGIYAYWCTPHKTLGMIGFVIVGDDLSNLDSIKKVKFIGKSKKIAKGLIAEIEG